MPNRYKQGQSVKCQGTWETVDGEGKDPANVFFFVTTPAGVTTPYEYGVDGELVKEDTGIYYIYIDASEIGMYEYGFYSTGSYEAAESDSFEIMAL